MVRICRWRHCNDPYRIVCVLRISSYIAIMPRIFWRFILRALQFRLDFEVVLFQRVININLDAGYLTYGGYAQSPENFISFKINLLHNNNIRQQGPQINRVVIVTKRVVSQEANMLPCHRRYFLEQCQRLRVTLRLIPVQQRGKQDGIVGNHHVGKQPATLVADGDIQIRMADKVFLAADLRDNRTELMIRSNAVL